MLKQLICFVVGCTTLGLTQPAAAAEYTLGIEGGGSSNIPNDPSSPTDNVVPGGTAVLNLGYVIQQRSDDQARNTAELTLGLLRIDQFPGKLIPGLPYQYPYSEKTFFLAPGTRYTYTGSFIQPFFALHVGWVANYRVTRSVPETTSFTASSMGVQVQTGVQFRVHPKLSFGLGASGLGLGMLANNNLYVSGIWRGFGTATFNFGDATW
jgi:hypothetical protein